MKQFLQSALITLLSLILTSQLTTMAWARSNVLKNGDLSYHDSEIVEEEGLTLDEFDQPIADWNDWDPAKVWMIGTNGRLLNTTSDDCPHKYCAALAPCKEHPGYCNAQCKGDDDPITCDYVFKATMARDKTRQESCEVDHKSHCWFPTCGTTIQCEDHNERGHSTKWLMAIGIITPAVLVIYICYRTPNLNDAKRN